MAGRVLIIEDSYLIAFEYAVWLRRTGYEVIGPAATAQEAHHLVATEQIDSAILDVQLGSEKCFSVADALATAGVPFFFLTGFTDDVIPPHLRSRPILIKPALENDFLEAVRNLGRG